MKWWKKAFAVGFCFALIMVSSIPMGSATSLIVTGTIDTEKIQEGNNVSLEPRIASDGNGNAITLWKQSVTDPANPKNNIGFDICVNLFKSSSGWGNATTLYSGEDPFIRYDIAINSEGDAIVAWVNSSYGIVRTFTMWLDGDLINGSEYGDRGYTVFIDRYTNGLGWEGPSIIYDGMDKGEGVVSDLSVAIGSNGDAAVAWYAGNKTNIYSQSPGSPGELTQITTDFIATYGPVTLAVNPLGDISVAWVEKEENAVYAARYSNGSGWDLPNNMDASVSVAYEDREVKGPLLKMNLQGDAVLVWSNGIIGDIGLFACQYLNGTGWGDVVQVQSNIDFIIQSYMSLYIGEDGSAALAWIQRDVRSFSAHVVKYDPLTGWGDSCELLDNSLLMSDIMVVIEPNGDMVAMWTQTSEDGYFLYEGCLDRSCNQVSLMSVQVLNQAEGAVAHAVDQNGSIIVVWAGSLYIENNDPHTNIYSIFLPSSTELNSQVADERSRQSQVMVIVCVLMVAIIALGLVYSMRKHV
jgi:hypothetical protein